MASLDPHNLVRSEIAMWCSNMQFAYTETRPRLTVVVAYGLVPI